MGFIKIAKRFIKRKFSPTTTAFIFRVSDIVVKYIRTSGWFRRKRRHGKYTYTVVSAVYNTAQYLDDFFNSLRKQTLNFRNNIQIVIVDDGSTDNTAEMIKKWQHRYPHNITYVFQGNSGPGAARRRGLELVKTPWVTFIDSDDFVHPAYFAVVDDFLTRHHGDMSSRSVRMLCCNSIFYMEKEGGFKNRHPLRFRFQHKETVLVRNDWDCILQLHIASAFFPTEKLLPYSQKMPSCHWPSFEDAYLILSYLDNTNSGVIGYCRGAQYYYRKRSKGDSLIDGSKQKKDRYLTLLREGYLGILRHSHNLNGGKTWAAAQLTVLYDLSWHIKEFCNNPPPACLNTREVEEYIQLLQECFSYISRETIEQEFSSSINAISFLHRVGMLSLFKKMNPSFFIVYIHRYDGTTGILRLVYYRGEDVRETFLLGGRPQIPFFVKDTTITFAGKQFCLRRELWFYVSGEEDQKFEARIGATETQLSLSEKRHQVIGMDDIRAAFKRRMPSESMQYADAWVFMDRDTEADDNAEHLYRYVMKNHPDKKIYFFLRQSSSDWNRLKAEGFNLVPFGSKVHKNIFCGCSIIISSHIDEYVTNFIGGVSETKRIVFLQHGMTSHDTSAWFNRKKIDLITTSSTREYDSIARNGSAYNLSAMETVLSGMARHDALAKSIGEHENMILIMPTWRKYLVASPMGMTNVRKPVSNFSESKYSKFWGDFLKAKRLQEIAKKYNMRIVFFPHRNMHVYLDAIDVPPCIDLPDPEYTIQDYFRKATVMVTDYSSVMYEMAFLRKPVVYYHFDHDEVFGGDHVWKKGSFDHVNDGFGPVAHEVGALCSEIENILARRGRPDDKYAERIDKAVTFRDGNNCSRIYEAILGISKPPLLSNHPATELIG